MKIDKKSVWLFAGLCVLVIGFLVFVGVTQFGGKEKTPADGNVTAALPDGEVQKMSDSKSEAFRGRVSTAEYFDQLGTQLDGEDISLVSSPEEEIPGQARNDYHDGSATGESSVSRVFGAPDSPVGDGRSRPAMTGGGASASRPMTEQERLDYDRRRAEMVRQVQQDAVSTAGTTFGGLVGDIASTVIRTGATIARSASGELSVSVVSGYKFYLVKSERK